MQYPVLNKELIEANISETKAKIPLLIKGNWHVPGFGLMSVTDEYIDKLKNNFESNVLGFKPYATLGHPTDSPDASSIDGQRKRGDLEEIVKEGNIVYGIYNINKETYDMLKSKEYEYSSPEIQQNFKDKVTGELKGPTLLRTALTNAPFMPFDDNKIVALSQESNEDNTSVYIKLSTTIESVSNDITEEPVKEEIKSIQENINMPSLQSELTPPTVVETKVESPALDLEAILSKVLEAQQKTIASTVESITAKFNETIEAANAKTAETVNAVINKVEELSNQVTTVVSKADEIEKSSQFITALSSSEKAKELNYKLNGLFEKGATPATLSLAKSILTNFDGNSVVKLSANGSEKEVSFEDSIIELVKLSSNIMPDVEQTGSQTEAKKESYFSTLIEQNKERAKAKVSK